MKVYTYSEARRRFAAILDEARQGGEVRIKRRDGSEFALTPVGGTRSPFDVPPIDADVSRADILQALQDGRARSRSG